MKLTKNKNNPNIPIAIVGIGCFFPKSLGLKEYWRLIFNHEDGITDIPESHWSPEDYFNKNPKEPDHVYCKRGGFLSPVSFDPAEFGIPPSSIEATDTSQILGLMAAKTAVDDAGYWKGKPFNRDRTSVILGITGTQELVIPLGARLGYPKWRTALADSGISDEKAQEVIKRISDSYVSWQENSFPGLLGNVVAGRICNRLDLGGTNCVVDAACASSMGAIHLAIMELVSNRSDMALTGGVDTLNDIFMHMCFAKTHTLSPTEDIRPFSKDADGTVLGEGVGIIVLKRLEDAEKNGDKIYAVIRSIGSSSDGKSQSIYAPKAEGQAKSLRSAYKIAGIEPATVGLIEAHGTGTRVGDMTELQSLRQVFGESNNNISSGKCALGSIKSMIGHTKAAAGTAGIIKAALALYHKTLPPTLKAENPRPELKIDASPFYLNTKSRPWFSKKDHPRRAGVSAFGFGGSNFHVLMEEYKSEKSNISWDGSVEIVALSAANKNTLIQLITSIKKSIDRGISNKEFSKTASDTRKNFSPADKHRLLMVIKQPLNPSRHISLPFDEALNALGANKNKNTEHLQNIYYNDPDHNDSKNCGKIAFMFPGQGSQYIQMGSDLICCFPKALEIMETANNKFKNSPYLTDYIYPTPVPSSKEKKHQEDALKSTDIAQPAIGAVSLAMLKILQEEFDVKPDATCGHSYGELPALYAAGWIDIETLFKLSIARGNLMAEAGSNNKSGTMLAVKAPIKELEELINSSNTGAILANKNSPSQGVLSGTDESIALADKICRQKGFKTIRLSVAAAFHSSLIKDAQKPFAKFVQNADIVPAKVPVFSNTTGMPYPADPDKAKKLLGEQILCPVNFVKEIESLFKAGVRTFVEIGPKTVLTGLVKSILGNQNFQAIAMDSSCGKKSGVMDLAKTLSILACLGHHVDLNKWEDPAKEIKKQLMSIPVSGANYRQESKQRKKPAKDITTSIKSYTKMDENMSVNKSTIINNNIQHPDIIADSLKTVQEGLKSMQALQLQTAEVHTKFLETQSEAGRMLQNMMDNTRRMAEASMGIKETCVEKTKQPVKSAARQHAITIKPEKSEPEEKIEEKIAFIPENPSVKPADNSNAVIKKDIADNNTSQNTRLIQDNMLKIVSDLTGYPVEMLNLDMDIETDLGIDSIKRVEILSTIEQKMPQLPSVSPEIMGKLKTLKQIVQYLCGQESLKLKAESRKLEAEKPATSNQQPATNNQQQTTIQDNMLKIVSDLTGYPVEMLNLDMDIETDLGIDSIKRVEILSTIEQKMPQLPSVSPEIMGKLKTLEQIAQYLCKAPKTYNSIEQIKEISNKVENIPVPGDKIDRKTVSLVEMPLLYTSALSIPAGRKVYITEDKTGLSQTIADELMALNIDADVVSLNTLKNRKNLPPAGGLVILPENNLTIAYPATNTNNDSQDELFLKNAFAVTSLIARQLIDSAKEGGAVFATVTRLDGAFGFKGMGMSNPVSGGLAGLAKTASIEWEDVRCHALDIDPGWKDKKAIAKNIVTELLNPDSSGTVEAGLSSDTRLILKLVSSPYPEGSINLNPDDVVVITGGARGVTAAAAYELAKQAKPTIILLGRSPYPSTEPEWLESLHDDSEIKKAIFKNEFSKKEASPALLEKSFKKHMANREISENLQKLKETGATVFYYSADVRDSQRINSVLEEIRSEYGPVKGIIHGAGTLKDRLIKDKTIEQFEKVFDTKVKGLKTILQATKQDNLKYIVLFSSITARMGNKGQADYAMANEVLNKTAQQESVNKTGCRVISINWGPWDGGMVSPALKQEFTRNNIELIPVESGAASMVCEMRGDRNSSVEVVIGKNIITQKPKKIIKKDKLSLTVKREIDIDKFPVLKSHIIGGKPVVPFALIAEWLGHGALHGNPGLFLHGLDDMQILNGIKLDQQKKTIRIMAGQPVKKGSFFEVDVEIRDGIKNGIDIIHSRAKAVLTDKFSQPPHFKHQGKTDSKPYPMSIKEAYDKILFHGAQLQGIKKITDYSSNKMTARISAAPVPSEWIVKPLRNRWIGDPLVMDSAFQMAILYSFEENGLVSLPSYTSSYRLYQQGLPRDEVTAVLEVKKITRHKMTCDFTFLDRNNVIVALLTGYEAVMDSSLLKAFKPDQDNISIASARRSA